MSRTSLQYIPLALLLACTSSEPAPVVTEVESSPVEVSEEVVEAKPPPKLDCAKTDPDDRWVKALLKRALPKNEVVAHPDFYRLQVVVGEIVSSGTSRCITWHPYRLGAEYYYPASAIKPIAAVGALHTFRTRKAEDPRLAHVDLNTPVRVEGADPGPDGLPVWTTVTKEIRAALEVSSNPAYNFTVDLAGYGQMHELMWATGLKSVRLRHRLSVWGHGRAAQRTTSRILAKPDNAEVELVARRVSKTQVKPHGQPGWEVGAFHRERGNALPVAGPMDFSQKNAVSLMDLTRLTAWIADPALAPRLAFPALHPEDRLLIRDAMSQVPDNWTLWKPLRAGVVEVIPGEDLFYMHKSGMAYGFFLDVGYVEQKSTGRAFLLGLSAHLNSNGIVNDGTYDYERLGQPMLRRLGQRLAHELLAVEGTP